MSNNSSGDLILVTGGSGFLSLHCIAQALNQGYRVRTTLRSSAKEKNVLKGLENAKPPVDVSRLQFVVADLLKDDGWNAAVKDARLVLHVASPFPGVQPSDENELIKPAVEGTLRVLRAAKTAGTVERVVVTSSVAAVAYGTAIKSQNYTEADWSDPEGKTGLINAYAKSKTLAEKAAWNFIKTEGNGMEMATVNPVGIFGPPLLLPNESTTVGVVKQMLTGALPAVPNVNFGLVDVRDVASLHLLAATKPEASGQRYIAVAGKAASLPEIAQILRNGLGDKASKVPTRTLPNFLVKVLSLFMAQLKSVAPELGVVREFDNTKAKSLGWSPKSNEESILSCAQALIDAKDI